MPGGLPTGIKVLLGIGTIPIIIGIVYFYIGTFIAKESILSFDKGIAYFVIGIVFIVYTLTIFTVVNIGEMNARLDRMMKK
jgi:hypothetical protein